MAPMMLDDEPEPSPRQPRIPSSTFVVSPATHDDVPTLVDIEFRAFVHERVNHVLSYRDYTKPGHVERTRSAYSAALANSPSAAVSQPASDDETERKRSTTRSRVDSRLSHSDPVVVRDSMTKMSSPSPREGQPRFWKVTDPVSGEVTTFAKTEIKAYTPEELRGPEDIGHEDDPTMNRDWFALNERVRRQHVGLEKHCCK